MNNLSWGTLPNKESEFKQLIQSLSGDQNKLKTVKVDLFIENEKGEQYLIDLKTVKPNKSNFIDFKRTLLQWTAIALTQNKDRKVNAFIAIPYNPYHPRPYQRWTLNGMFDLPHELKVAEEFWDFLGGKGAYDDLLDCFETAGLELRSEIDEYFKKFI
jgi:type II restriction enzyme